MSHDPHLEDLLASFSEASWRRALHEAYRRGQDAMRREILATLQSEIPSQAADQVDDDDGGRAPRGLAREVIQMILQEHPNIGTGLVQEQAITLDRRLSPKTVYNELNREKGRLYRLNLGRWSLIPTQQQREDATVPDAFG
jgi:hypothetical protein